MATIPDLDTSTVGYIAFINVYNHGVNSIDPTEVLSWGEIESETQYDNGVEGYINEEINGANQNQSFQYRINWRIKSDGWVIAWTDRTNESNKTDAQNGWYNLVDDWNTLNRAPGTVFPDTTLSNAIDQMVAQLSNSGSISYSTSDIGYYNYVYPDATNADMYHVNDGTSWSLTFNIASGTNVKWLYAGGKCRDTEAIRWNGNTIVQSSGENSSMYDIKANLSASAGTSHTIDGDNNGSGLAMIIWS